MRPIKELKQEVSAVANTLKSMPRSYRFERLVHLTIELCEHVEQLEEKVKAVRCGWCQASVAEQPHFPWCPLVHQKAIGMVKGNEDI